MEENNKNTILIVDDEPQDVDILNELLSDYKRIIALNGQKALKHLEDFTPDLILLDIIMPGLDGLEVCRIIKDNPKTKDIPIMFISAINDTSDKVKGFKLGAVDYITKPFQPEEVLSRVNTHIELYNYKKRLLRINDELNKKVEERTAELIIEKEHAQESSRLKSHFLMLMSHELRTPMSGILGFSEILKNEVDSEELKDMVDALISSADRLKHTLNSILNLSRLESDKLKPEYTDTDLILTVTELLTQHEVVAKNKKLKLSYHHSDNELYNSVDPMMFELIVNNMINNAIKYTCCGEIKVYVYRKDNYDYVEVVDSGIGIPKDKHEIIFDEFRQVDEGTSRNFQGLGLGLSLVKKFTDLHNGKISLESEPGEGTSIAVGLPVLTTTENVTNDKDIIREKNIESHNFAKKLNILVVEDDASNLNIIKLFLKDVANIDGVSTGTEGINAAKEKEYDAVILDINLGEGQSGIDVAQEIRKLAKYHNKPIIAHTAYAMQGDRELFLSGGCTHYLPKPCKKWEMVNMVLKVIP